MRTAPKTVVKELFGSLTVGPGREVEVEGAHAASTTKLQHRGFNRGVTHDQFLHIHQCAPFLPGMGASGLGS